MEIKFLDGTVREYKDLSYADLSGANLRDADLSGANLRYADLSGANLRDADLRDADLSGAVLRGANLRDADLRDADLHGAVLRYADLSDANLSDADLSGIKYNHLTSFFALQCPEGGDFVGYKKCHGIIVKLLITGKRSSATSRKCRCSEAKVLEIEGGLTTIPSDRDATFIYKVGEIVKVENFDEDRWQECSTGIHFFITRDEALNYN